MLHVVCGSCPNLSSAADFASDNYIGTPAGNNIHDATNSYLLTPPHSLPHQLIHLLRHIYTCYARVCIKLSPPLLFPTKFSRSTIFARIGLP